MIENDLRCYNVLCFSYLASNLLLLMHCSCGVGSTAHGASQLLQWRGAQPRQRVCYEQAAKAGHCADTVDFFQV